MWLGEYDGDKNFRDNPTETRPMSREPPIYRGWSNSKTTKCRISSTRRINYPKVPVLHAKLVSDSDDQPQSSVNVKRKPKETATQSQKLKLIFQPPLDKDKKLSKTETSKKEVQARLNKSAHFLKCQYLQQ